MDWHHINWYNIADLAIKVAVPIGAFYLGLRTQYLTDRNAVKRKIRAFRMIAHRIREIGDALLMLVESKHAMPGGDLAEVHEQKMRQLADLIAEIEALNLGVDAMAAITRDCDDVFDLKELLDKLKSLTDATIEDLAFGLTDEDRQELLAAFQKIARLTFERRRYRIGPHLFRLKKTDPAHPKQLPQSPKSSNPDDPNRNQTPAP